MVALWCAFVAAIGLSILALKVSSDPPSGTVSHMLGRGVLVVSMVRNEERSIAQMIESSKQIGGYWLFCDTGSTDATKDIIREKLKHHLPAVLDHSPFVNFAHNRNACLRAAQEAFLNRADIKWVVLMDADQRVIPSWEHGKKLPVYDINYIQILNTDGAYNIANTLPYLIRAETLQHCRYRLYTHELLECKLPKWDKESAPLTQGTYKGYVYKHDYWKGGSKSDKYERDARLLQQWIKDTANNTTEQDLFPRALFYLGRSYQGMGNYSAAIKTYEQHRQSEIYTNYWFYSRYARAQSIFRLCGQNFTDCGYTFQEVERAYLDAHEELDGYFRREPLYYLARMHSSNGNYTRCLLYTSAALGLPPIDQSRMPLFVERVVYNWALEEQHAHCLEHLGRKELAHQHYKRLLFNADSLGMSRRARERINAKVYT